MITMDGHLTERQMEEATMTGEMYMALEELQKCREFCSLIPEVRTNMVYARKDATDVNDVLGVQGRITIVDGHPTPGGGVRFGASSHLARFLLGIRKEYPELRCLINFANDPKLVRFLTGYSHAKGWELLEIDRSNEPEEIKEAEGASMPWKVGKVLAASKGRPPRIAYENGAVGKEPVTALIGGDPLSVVQEMCAIARAFAAMDAPQVRVGKIGPDTLSMITGRMIGAQNDDVLVPPLPGVDAGVVRIAPGKVMIVAEDPIFTVPGLSLEMFGWAVVHIGASDVAVMGAAPMFMTYTLLLPPTTSDLDIEIITGSIHKAAKEIGVAIVGGHTGFSPGLTMPMVGGITVFSICDEGAFITPRGARPGDDVIMTKGPAIEAAAALANVGRRELEKVLPADAVRKAADLWWEMSVVEDCRIALQCGGVNAMHDATEGGVINGLHEICEASGVGMEVFEERMPTAPEADLICSYYELDRLKVISEGTLILTCSHGSSDSIIRALGAAGIRAGVAGTVLKDAGIRKVHRANGTTEDIVPISRDEFWDRLFTVAGRLDRPDI